jgi:hypothetical protein
METNIGSTHQGFTVRHVDSVELLLDAKLGEDLAMSYLNSHVAKPRSWLALASHEQLETASRSLGEHRLEIQDILPEASKP